MFFTPEFKKQINKSLIYLFRTLILLFFLFWTLATLWPTPSLLKKDEPCRIHCSACQERLASLFQQSLRNAKKSIDLYIYSLSDPQIIKELNKAAEKGITVHVIYDTKTDPRGFTSLHETIKKSGFNGSALMHRKILVIDSQTIWIGSANFTRESLRMHENLIIGFLDPILGTLLHEGKFGKYSISLDNQNLHFYPLPQAKKESFIKILELLNGATKTIDVAMFTFTHPILAEVLVEAKKRGVKVNVIVDRQSANGASKKVCKYLLSHQVAVRTNRGSHLFHHKFLLVDEKILVSGSANWTKAAFEKNNDCFLIIDPLTRKQQKKLRHLKKVNQCTTIPL